MGLIGTVQNMVGSEVYPAKYTTPEAHELLKLFSLMVQAGCQYCVMEVSSQALAQGLHFALAAFSNLSQDHLDYHKTWENYLIPSVFCLRIATKLSQMQTTKTA